MFGLGIQELALVFIVVMLLFGYNKAPEIGRSLGKAIAAFKHGLKEDDKPPTPSGEKPKE
jgi:sec-independent protein translocase protein TatA